MISWLAGHFDALRVAMRRLIAAPVNTLLSLLAIGIALSTPLGGLVLFAATQGIAGSSALPQISVFMTLDTGKNDVVAMESKLKRTQGVDSVRLLTRETTLARMRKTEELAEVIDALPRNPFPDAFVVAPAVAEAAAIEQMAAQLKTWPKVDHVQIDSAWVVRLNAMLRLGKTVLVALSILLGFGLVAIIFSSTRSQVLALKNEIEVSQLLGATNAFISRPFLYVGWLQGLLGGFVAWIIVATLTSALRKPMADLAKLYDVSVVISLPDSVATLTVLAVASALGWVGTTIALRQHLWRSSFNR